MSDYELNKIKSLDKKYDGRCHFAVTVDAAESNQKYEIQVQE